MGLLTTLVCLFVFGAAFGQCANVAAASNTDVGGNKDGGVSFFDFNGDGSLDVIINTNDNLQNLSI